MNSLRTYAMDPEPSPPETWADYERRARGEWEHLLSSDLPEKAYHQFLERNPAFVPGAHGTSLTSGHMPFQAGVYTRPVLPGYTERQPDMMWIGTTSSDINPVLIEIERPSKCWYTKSGVPSHEFTQARNQITEWREWFGKSHNSDTFREGFHLTSWPESTKPISPVFVLVYGRSRDVERMARRRVADKRPDEEIMTFDRLSPSRDQMDYLCLRHSANGTAVVTFPSTARIGPNIVYNWVGLSGFVDAVDKSAAMSPERKAFLKRRLPYWLEWARDPPGIVSTGDWE